MTQLDTLLTAGEVAKVVRQSPETVRRWARDGDIACIRLPGGRLRFRRSVVDTMVGEPSGQTH